MIENSCTHYYEERLGEMNACRTYFVKMQKVGTFPKDFVRMDVRVGKGGAVYFQTLQDTGSRGESLPTRW